MPDINHTLIQRFALTRPLVFEDIERGHEVITEPERTVIRSDAESLEQDLAEMLSIAKFSEIDPLLGTFYSQPHPTEREMKYLGQFAALCAPLKNAWVWRIMRQTVPDVYEREIADLLNLWEHLHDREVTRQSAFGTIARGAVNIDDPEVRNHALGLWAIMRENPEYNITLQLTGNRENLPAWHRYIAVLTEFITNSTTPNSLLYTILPDITEADYRVRIVQESSGMRVYDIRERTGPGAEKLREAVDHLEGSIRLMEQSRNAVKSKTIAQARTEAEKARAILEKLL